MAHIQRISIYDDIYLLTSELENQSSRQGLKNFFNTPIPQHAWVNKELVNKVDISKSDSIRVAFSKPLLLIFMYGATRCCEFILSNLAVDDLVNIVEDAGNLLHALVIGCQRQLQPWSVFAAILTDVFDRLSEEELRRLNACSGHLGLRPVELAVRLDVFWMSERLLCNGVLKKVETTVYGPDLIIDYDLGEYAPHANESRYFVSPLILLGENLSTDRLLTIKKSNILRPNSLFRAWVDFSIQRDSRYSLSGICFIMISFLTFIFSGFSFTKKRIACACHDVNAEPPSTIDGVFEIAALVFVTFLVFSILFTSNATIISVSRFYKKIGYVYTVNRLAITKAFVHYYGPAFALIIGLLVWISVVINPSFVCDSVDLHTFIVVVFAFICFSVFYVTVNTFQYVGNFSQFLTKLFDIQNRFIPFLFLYLLDVIVFARIFENITFRHKTLNETSDLIVRQLFNDYTQSVYTAFRLSLNIVDLPRADSGILFMIFHGIYVLIVPFMIFNYIIGVISTELSTMVEVREESSLLRRGCTVTSGIFASSYNKVRNAKRRSNEHVLTVCSRITESCFSNQTRNKFIEMKIDNSIVDVNDDNL